MTHPDTRKLVAQWLVEHHAAMLLLARRFADALHGPEDIVSQAGVVALERREQATEVESPLGWLLTITKSVGLQVVRKRNRRAALRGSAPREDSGLLDSSHEAVVQNWSSAEPADERCDRVLEIARGLPPALRQLVHHVLLDGWNDDEIADFYGITPAAVRQRRKRAILAIQRALDTPPPPVS